MRSVSRASETYYFSFTGFYFGKACFGYADGV